MMILASTWLGLALLLSAYSWVASKRLPSLFLPVAAMIAAFALYVQTGTPRFTKPPAGEYTVVGADIQVGEAIFVLLKAGNSSPVYYKLPYTTQQANALQGAEDAGQGQPGSVKMEVGLDGGTKFDGPPPVSGDPPKQAEQPAAIQIP